jgi:hypothetical protein
MIKSVGTALLSLLFSPIISKHLSAHAPGASGCQTGDDDRQLSRLDRLSNMHLKTRLQRAQSVFASPVGRQRDGRNLIRR